VLELHCISLFGNDLLNFVLKGLIKRGYDKKLFKFHTHNLRDFAAGKHKKVDDYPFSQKKGMLLRADVVYNAITSIEDYQNMAIIYTCPKGPVYTQRVCNELFESTQNIILISGYYEGIDERIFDLLPIKRVSIGDYIVNSGDCAAAVIAESLIRKVPGVLGNNECIEDDTHFIPLLEAPHYTQPVTVNNNTVPSVYRSGNHGLIEKHKLKQALKNTLFFRPDLLGINNITKIKKEIITEIIKEMAVEK
jgi:tRNA (guanine37-N1)-methyltransferase